MNVSNISSGVSFHSGGSRYRSGNSDVSYSDDGRLDFYKPRGAAVSQNYVSNYQSYEPSTYSRPSRFDTDSNVKQQRLGYDKSSPSYARPGRGNYPYQNRDNSYERRYAPNEYQQRTNPTQSYDRRINKTASNPSQQIGNDIYASEEYKKWVSSIPQKPGISNSVLKSNLQDVPSKRLGWLFIVSGVINLLCATIDVLLGTMPHYYFSGFWTGFLVMEFGVLLLTHNGNYESKGKNWGLVIFGFLSVGAIFASMNFIAEDLIDNIIFLYTEESTQTFISSFENQKYSADLNIQLNLRVWILFSVKWVFITFYFIDSAIFTQTIKIFNTYRKKNNPAEGMSDELPDTFGPYTFLFILQIVASLSIISRIGVVEEFFGMGSWTNWIPFMACLLGFINGIGIINSYKDLDNRSTVNMSMILQIISLLGFIAATFISIYALIDNISNVEKESNKVARTKIIISIVTVTMGTAGVILTGFYACLMFVIMIQALRKNMSNREIVQTWDTRSRKSNDSTSTYRGKISTGFDAPAYHSKYPQPQNNHYR